MKIELLDKVVTKSQANRNIYTVIDFDDDEVVVLDAGKNPLRFSEDELYLYQKHSPIYKDKYDNLAMYIIVKDTCPIGLGINACSHVAFMAGRHFESPLFEQWLNSSFRKRTCIVTEEEFDLCIKSIHEIGGNWVEFVEPDWRNDTSVSAAFSPMYCFPDIFRKIKLHPGYVS